MSQPIALNDAGPPTLRRLRAGALTCYALAAVILSVVLYHHVTEDAVRWGFRPMCAGVLALWAGNMLLLLGRWIRNLPILVFHLTFALFILGEPLVRLITGEPFTTPGDVAGVSRALWICTVGLITLPLGHAAVTTRCRREGTTSSTSPRQLSRGSHRALLGLTLIAVACYAVTGLEAWLYVRQHSYSAYYVSFSSALPAPVSMVATVAPYLVAATLAHFRPGRSWLLVGLGFVVMTLPELALGRRGPAVRAVLFLLCYAVVRWRRAGGTVLRVPRLVALGAVALVPLVVVALGVLGQAREVDTDQISAEASGHPAARLVQNQSVTFPLIARGSSMEYALPNREDKTYTVGSLRDYAVYGQVGRMLFHTEPLGVNTLRRATVGHSFADAFSYRIYGDRYLKGLGAGSSYLIESYLDGRYPLVALVSLLAGALLAACSRCYGRSWLVSTLLLVAMQGIFTLPRDTTSGFLVFLITPQFWVMMLLVAAFHQRHVAQLLDTVLVRRPRATRIDQQPTPGDAP